MLRYATETKREAGASAGREQPLVRAAVTSRRSERTSRIASRRLETCSFRATARALNGWRSPTPVRSRSTVRIRAGSRGRQATRPRTRFRTRGSASVIRPRASSRSARSAPSIVGAAPSEEGRPCPPWRNPAKPLSAPAAGPSDSSPSPLVAAEPTAPGVAPTREIRVAAGDPLADGTDSAGTETRPVPGRDGDEATSTLGVLTAGGFRGTGILTGTGVALGAVLTGSTGGGAGPGGGLAGTEGTVTGGGVGDLTVTVGVVTWTVGVLTGTVGVFSGTVGVLTVGVVSVSAALLDVTTAPGS